MALPEITVEDLNAQTAAAKDDRQRLQKSLRAGQLNIVKAVQGLHNPLNEINASINLFSDKLFSMFDKDRAQAGFKLEEEREEKRSGGGGGAGNVEVHGDVNVDAGQKKSGFLKGLIGGLGSFLTKGASAIGLGGGALLAGAGIFAGGAGYALKQFNNLDGKAIKENIKELLTINNLFSGSWDAFKKGGTFLVVMGTIGAGLALFGAGSAIAGMSQTLLDKFGSTNWTQSIVDNVEILLGINKLVDGLGGALLEGGTFLLVMAGIAAGLVLFSAGSIIGNITDGVTKFTNASWAQSIVDNVKILLSISTIAGGLGSTLLAGGTFLVAMASIGTGLALFSAASAIAGVAEGVTNFTNASWAQSVVDNVTTLLSISTLVGGVEGAFKEGGTFLIAMAGIGAGLAVFSIGQGIKTAVSSFTTPDWAVTIVDNVKSLLSISSTAEGVGSATAFPAVMTNIADGLVNYSAGILKSKVIEFFSGPSNSERIAKETKMVMSIMADPNITESKSIEFKFDMANISTGLNSFAGGGFVQSLANAGTAIVKFFTPGGEKKGPIEEVIELSKHAVEVDQASNAMIKLAGALARMSDLKFDGSKLNFKEFAEDLAKSVPAIESAIMGGTIDGGWFKSPLVYKGLASPDIKMEEAAERINLLKRALGTFTMEGPPRAAAEQSLKDHVSHLAPQDGGNMNINANPVNIQKGGDTSVVQGTINAVPQVRQTSSLRANPYQPGHRGWRATGAHGWL